jgi:hypothetical protein
MWWSYGPRCAHMYKTTTVIVNIEFVIFQLLLFWNINPKFVHLWRRKNHICVSLKGINHWNFHFLHYVNTW